MFKVGDKIKFKKDYHSFNIQEIAVLGYSSLDFEKLSGRVFEVREIVSMMKDGDAINIYEPLDGYRTAFSSWFVLLSAKTHNHPYTKIFV